ncbi:MAG: riboflavin deaminase, partial [Microcystis sp. M53603_WE2]|nr:riboflavin deaminase [Microcystis sp. M53603_WE2]
MNRPHTTVILAMSADGKIADAYQSAARFASVTDKMRLEQHLSRMDAALFCANTLRAYHTRLPIRHADF